MFRSEFQRFIYETNTDGSNKAGFYEQDRFLSDFTCRITGITFCVYQMKGQLC